MTADERHEVELKLIAADAGPLRRLARTDRLGRALLGPPAVADEIDRYLDTADGRLAQGRWACRLRTRGGRTIVSLKGPGGVAPGAAALHRRREVEGPATTRPAPGRWPPSPASRFLEELAGDAPLVERFRLLQERTEREVTVDARRAGLLSLDRVRVLHQSRHLGDLFMVELELEPAAAEDTLLVDALAGALAAEPGLRPDRHSKLEHALELIGAAAAPGAGGAPAT